MPDSTGAINTGTIPALVNDVSLVPSYQYVHPCSYENRVTSSTIDIGAFRSTPPIVVNAGSDQQVFRPDAATLNGSATGGDGTLTFSWSQVSGPGTATFADPAAVVTTVTFSEGGMYVLQLAATDGLLSGTDTITVSVDPPCEVADLAASDPTPTSLMLTWTAPGDSGNTGTAASYEIRYSTSAITAANFSNAAVLGDAPAPAAAGKSQYVTVSGLSQGTTYYFALKTTNHAAIVSGISNIANGQTGAVQTEIAAIKRNPGLTDGRDVDAVFTNTVTDGTLPIYTGLDVIADASYLYSNMGWAQSDMYLNSGGAVTAQPLVPMVIKFRLNEVPDLAGSTIAKAQVRFYSGGGNYGSLTAGLVSTSDWTEGTCVKGYPGSAGGVSAAFPTGYNTGPYQTADGTPIPGVGYPPNMSLCTFGWADDLPFSISKDCTSTASLSVKGLYGVTSGQGDQYITLDITTFVQAWVDGAANYGMAVNPGNYGFFLSENMTNPDWQPILFVQYIKALPTASVPSAPRLGLQTGDTVKILGLGSENDAATAYLVQEATTGLYVGPDGHLEPIPFWQARDAWAGTAVSGLSSLMTCQFQSKARNRIGLESDYGPLATPLAGSADINGDGYVNVGDLQALAAAWGTLETDTAWNASADCNGDGYINVGDLQVVIDNWADTVP